MIWTEYEGISDMIWYMGRDGVGEYVGERGGDSVIEHEVGSARNGIHILSGIVLPYPYS